MFTNRRSVEHLCRCLPAAVDAVEIWTPRREVRRMTAPFADNLPTAVKVAEHVDQPASWWQYSSLVAEVDLTENQDLSNRIQYQLIQLLQFRLYNPIHYLHRAFRRPILLHKVGMDRDYI